MKKLLSITVFLFSTWVLNAQALVIPFGVQTDVANATVDNWGWSECYSETAARGGADLTVAGIKTNCIKSHTMMGLFNNSSNQYEVLAAGLTDVVFNDTPGVFNTSLTDGFNQSNGVNWYLYDNPTSVYGAWGFFSGGSSVLPVHCDYQEVGNVNKSSLCMHMRDIDGSGDGSSSDDYISDVYSFFDHGVNTYAGNSTYTVRFLGLDEVSTVPEPSTLLLMSVGLLGLLGVNRRRAQT